MIETYVVVELVNPQNSQMLNENDLEILHTLIREGWNIHNISDYEGTAREKGANGFSFKLDRSI